MPFNVFADASVLGQIINAVGNVIIVIILSVLAFTTMGIAALVLLIRKITKAINRQMTGEPVEAEPVKVPDRGLNAVEKQALAAEAMRKSLAVPRYVQGINYDAVQALLGDVLKGFNSKTAHMELKRVRSLYASLHSFLKDEKNFAYSLITLDRAMCGMAELLKDGGESNAQLVVGMMYALEAMQAKWRSTYGMAEAAESAELSEELDELVSNLDKLGWLFLTYPEHGKKYASVMDNMVQQVETTLGVYTHAVQHGVKSRETGDFLQNAKKALADINDAAQGILNDILNMGVMQADAELEMLRQDIRMRGLGK